MSLLRESYCRALKESEKWDNKNWGLVLYVCYYKDYQLLIFVNGVTKRCKVIYFMVKEEKVRYTRYFTNFEKLETYINKIKHK